MNFIDLDKAKEIYKKGGNVTEYLRKEFNESDNTSEITEIAYDLQAGSYIKDVTSNSKQAQLYTAEMAALLETSLTSSGSILDVGAGELTSLTPLLNNLKTPISEVLALDISWSRLYKGREYFKKNINNKETSVTTFVAEMKLIPLQSKCIDVVISSHALEPNRKDLSTLLKELFRVAKRRLVLFEPSYELNSDEGRRRMDKHRYIKGVEGAVSSLGGRVKDIIALKNVRNPLNPTACYVIEPPIQKEVTESDKAVFCVPGTSFPLTKTHCFLKSSDTALVFPILDGIPILKNEHGILSTALFEE